MELNETVISKAITESWHRDFIDCLEVDVAIAGGGPAGLTAAYYLAQGGAKVLLLERKLSLGGGMWGGGMMYNRCVFQSESMEILDELGIRTKEYEPGYYVTDSLETVATLISSAIRAGARIFNLLGVEDVMIREKRITGLVINWAAVGLASLHVDPMVIKSDVVIDATGHATEVTKIVVQKMGPGLLTETGEIMGEKPMWAEVGERTIVENTREAYPGLYVAGMAANAVFGGPRMGPIFGGMLLSGKKVAEMILG